MIWLILEWIWFIWIYITLIWNGIIPEAVDDFPGALKVVFPVRLDVRPEMYNQTLAEALAMPNAFNQTYWLQMHNEMEMNMNYTMDEKMMNYTGMDGMTMMKPNGHWGRKSADFGNFLLPFETLNMPRVYWDKPDMHKMEKEHDHSSHSDMKPKYHTLIEIDLDGSAGNFLHWMIVNIPGSNLAKGEIKVPYISSSPPAGTGVHRYVWVLYTQPKGFQDFSSFPTSPMNPLACLGNRFDFKLDEFVKEFNLEECKVNFVKVKHDSFVDVMSVQTFEQIAFTLDQNTSVCDKPFPPVPPSPMPMPMPIAAF